MRMALPSHDRPVESEILVRVSEKSALATARVIWPTLMEDCRGNQITVVDLIKGEKG